MSRNYHILYKNYIANSSNRINLDINEIDTIVNHSADSIFCSCLNYINKSKFSDTISMLLEKIKPSGKLNIECINIKKYMNNFLQKKISGDDLMSKIKNAESIISEEDFYVTLNTQNFRIIQIESSNSSLFVSIERIGI
jgi:uncharacterized protein (UPF0332 family)